MKAVLLGVVLAGCGRAPLDMALHGDGVTYAGVAVVDITPVITETFDDVNGNHDFDGCIDDPGCAESFDDVNGNGVFDAVWIGGFGPLRPATEVHDPISARAVVIAHDREYLAIVTLDLVGLGFPRIHEARDRLAADGFDPDRLLVNSSHNHQGPDTMGLWGDPENFADPTSGRDPAYQARIADAIEAAVREAAAAMVPIDLRVGRLNMRDRSPYFNGASFGGRNPDAIMHGMIHDGRDPVVVSDQLLVLNGQGPEGTVFTLTSWSGHPEVRGSSNNAISADWVGVAREVIEGELGGVALHMPECLGGMQSALGGELPLVDEAGVHAYQVCDANAVADTEDAQCFGRDVGSDRVDDEGLQVPVWAERDSWAFVTSHGWHIGEAAVAALEDAETIAPSPLRVEVEDLYVPVENVVYQILGPMDMFDLGFDNLVVDAERCPDMAGNPSIPGCLATRTFRVQAGPIGLIGVPGELLPELAWGFPDDPRWATEAADPAARGPGSTYFPQHDNDCDAVDYTECRETDVIGDCDCLKVHASPYSLSDDPTVPPLLSLWGDDIRYRAAISMTDNYLSYVIPEPDFNRHVSLLTDDRDHYEDTVSPAHNFASRVQEAQLRIDARW